jgi:hypothetical protein
MKWYLTKLVFQIICGDGNHTPQFDEQLRVIYAGSSSEAYEKARNLGSQEAESFLNQRQQLVSWKFIGVPEVSVMALDDGAEIYSRIREEEDEQGYINFVRQKALALQQRKASFIVPSI